MQYSDFDSPAGAWGAVAKGDAVSGGIPSRFKKLKMFAGALASVFSGTSTVKSDFNIEFGV